MPLFLENPPGGGGSGQDRFAPKYVVGNIANGDSAVEYSTDGFYYFADPGTGVGAGLRLAAALAAATPTDPDFVALGDVWIRPGTYRVSQTLVVPPTCTVRGSGAPTLIESVDDTIDGPLISLGNKSALYSMSLAHNVPKENPLDPTQYGVVDLRGDAKSALCEDVDVATVWGANPTNSTLYGGFVAYNAPAGANATTLRCVRCSVVYGLNSVNIDFDIETWLAGYRMKDASLELVDCTSRYAVPVYWTGNSVIGNNFGNGSLTVRGGNFQARAWGVFCKGTADTRMVVDGANISVVENSNQTYTVGSYGKVNSVIANNTLIGGVVQSILFDSLGAAATSNCGQVIGNRINVGGGTAPWTSVDGYHVFVANTYTGATAPVSAVNDEVAHNINIP